MTYTDEFDNKHESGVTESNTTAVDDTTDIVITTESIENNTPEEFLTDSDLNALKFLKMKGQINDIKSMITAMSDESKKFIDDDNLSKHLDEQICELTAEEIEKLSDEKIIEIYTINGEEIQLAVVTPDKKKDVEFKRDYLVFKKKTIAANEKFEQEITVIESEIAQSQEEFDKVMSTFGNVSNVVVERLKICITNADSNEKKERFEKYLNSFNNAFTLDNVITFAKSYKGANVLGDYHNSKKSNDIYKRYMKVSRALKLKQDLTQFVNIEKYLPEEYKDRPNIFMFTVISMIASWHNKPIERTEGLFLSQFSINLKNLIYNHFDSQDEKNAFLQNIITVIDIRR